ncbi:MAG: PilN domain-containing protein, partial [Porticoccaceae bacterium]|nr:PilN domain-containing protein [Porticoccaceae bacterium]
MALINLLPWREEQRQEKQKEFLSILMLVLIVALIAAFAWHSMVQGQIENQQSRNKMLQDNIKLLDNDLKEIKKLEETKKLWLARMDVIQGLQSNRAEVVKVFDQFARAVPDGAFLSEMELSNEATVSLKGFAESNARVSAFMRRLDESEKFDKAGSLTMGKDETLGEDGTQFEFKAQVVKPAS